MSKTVEELLLPRYKVINKWPAMEVEPFELNQIVTLEYKYDGFVHIPLKHLPNSFLHQSFFDNYPHLFKKLEWWEERTKEDLPMYLKDDERIWKLKKWRLTFFEQPFPINEVDKDGETEMFCSIAWHFRKDKMLPATAEEYEAFKSKTTTNDQ